MKRFLDIILSFIALVLFSPILIPIIFLVWIQDWHSPFYIAPRVGKNGQLFDMVKLRSMIINADKSKVDSTSSNDKRITNVGRFIRRNKLDELSQLWNVLKGDMSLVGPRPNVKRETDLYTSEEKLLISIKPGITDFSSIVFSDEGDILKDQVDPDIAYNQLIRPRKSMLGIFYVNNRSLLIDIKLIFITVMAVISKQIALKSILTILRSLKATDLLLEIASREKELTPMPPPGAKDIVTNREGRIQ